MESELRYLATVCRRAPKLLAQVLNIRHNRRMDVAFVLIVFGVSLGLYFLPTIVAIARKVPNVGSVFVVNLLLGWLLVPWVIALAMAVRSVPQPKSRGGYQPLLPSPANWAPPSPAGRVG